MSNKHKKIVLWIFGVALFALIAGHFRPEFPVNIPVPYTPGVPCAHHTARGCIYTPAPAPTPPATAAAGQASGSPASSGAPTASPVARGRGAPSTPAPSVSIDELGKLMDAQPSTIKSITFTNGSNDVLVSRDGSPDFKVTVSEDGGKQDLRNQARADHIPVTVKEVTVDPVVDFISRNLMTIVIFGGFLAFMIIGQIRQQKMMKGVGGMGASRSKDAAALKESIKATSFDDIAGCDEAVKELKRVVKGHTAKGIYKLFRSKPPRGVMLVGPPGTGKTHLARAVAAAVDGTFDFTSGSDFVEMLVGVGAARVRDMFDKGRKKVKETGKPHIIFIDEIDAVGGHRGGGMAAGSNSEREQTLNQLLVEMDGMLGNEGIILIAATNRIDMLDKALLRPGRFDCHVSVDLPDNIGRREIFKIHLRDRVMGEGVTLELLSHRTATYSGAEIEGVCNRAATLAAERVGPLGEELKAQGKSEEEILKLLPREILLEEFDEGIDFVRYGAAIESKQSHMSEKDNKNTAVHEGGHAVVSAALPACDPVVKITRMRRSRALGYVQSLPEEDRVSFTRDQAVSRIIVMMAGRAAQEEILGPKSVDTGASNDFQQATDMARNMVVSWGMSKLGHISVGDRQDAMGTSGGAYRIGPDLANRIDVEVLAITEACYKAARAIVKADRKRIEVLVEALMVKTTMLAPEWKALLAEHPSEFDLKTLDHLFETESMEVEGA